MAVAAKTSMLDKTIDMIQILNDDELEAIQSVARIFIMNPQIDRPYQRLSEEQLIARIDASLENVRKGLYEDADKVEADLIAEFDL